MRRLVVVLALAAAPLLAACGGQAGEGQAGDDVAAAATDFARCMRDHGFEVPDPTFDEDGLPRFGDMPGRVTDPAFDDARRTCAGPLHDALAAAGKEVDKPTDTAALLPFARCMREQGIDFPDPVPEEPLRIPKAAFGSPAWEPAVRACADTVPEEWHELLEPVRPKGRK
jgi:predicted small secreted protein